MEWLAASNRLAAKLFEKGKDQMAGFALTFLIAMLFLGVYSITILWLFFQLVANSLYMWKCLVWSTTLLLFNNGYHVKGLVRLVLSGAVVSAENAALCFCSWQSGCFPESKAPPVLLLCAELKPELSKVWQCSPIAGAACLHDHQ